MPRLGVIRLDRARFDVWKARGVLIEAEPGSEFDGFVGTIPVLCDTPKLALKDKEKETNHGPKSK